MQKVIIILFIFSFIGCSVFRNREEITLNNGNENIPNISKILKQNLSAESFLISKIEITLERNREKQKFLCNVKYENSGKILISLRSSNGIEGIRIYIDRDTILVNDRINRKLYYGSSLQLYEKYRISIDYLPVLLGDMIIEKESLIKEDNRCLNGIAEITGLIGKRTIRYNIDCNKSKVTSAEFVTDSCDNRIYAEFKKFNKIKKNYYPSIISIDGVYDKDRLNIKIKEPEAYKGPELKLIPGNNYELILLK